MPTTTLYTTSWCGDCRRVKQALDELGVEYHEVDIEADLPAMELVMRINHGKRVVPTLVFGGGFHPNPSFAALRALFGRQIPGSSAPLPTGEAAVPSPNHNGLTKTGAATHQEITMTTTFPVHTLDTAPESSKELLSASKAKYGFLPNLMGMLAESPAALGAYLDLGTRLGSSSLSPVEQQVVLLAVSTENHCDYCVAAHSVVAGMFKVPADVVAALRDGTTITDPRLEALAKFTRAVVRDRGQLSPQAVASFLGAGFERPHILDVVLGVAMKTLSNYANHLAETPLDAAFAGARWEIPTR